MLRTSVSRLGIEALEDRLAPGDALGALSPLAFWESGLPGLEKSAPRALPDTTPVQVVPLPQLPLSIQAAEALPEVRPAPTVPSRADYRDELGSVLGSLRLPDPDGPTTAALGAVRPGFNSTFLPQCDDCSSGPIGPGFLLRLGGLATDVLFVNNNGNVTLDMPLSAFIPQDLSTFPIPMMAPLWEDVNTLRTNGVVHWGNGVIFDYGPALFAWGATWRNVPGFGLPPNVTNTFQIVIINSFPIYGFDIVEMNYDRVEWDDTPSTGGQCARAGYTDGSGAFFQEAFDSGVCGSLLDTSAVGLANWDDAFFWGASGVAGRHLILL